MGDGNVGKTSIKRSFIGLGFESTYLATLGADFSIKEHIFQPKDKKEKVLVKFMIWDLAGQFRFGSVRPHYYLGSHAGLIIYDVTNRNSLENVMRWAEEFKKTINNPVPIALIGNKIDLRDEQKVLGITTEEGQNICKILKEFVHKVDSKSGAHQYDINFLETSAKTGENINKAFDSIAEELYKRYLSDNY